MKYIEAFIPTATSARRLATPDRADFDGLEDARTAWLRRRTKARVCVIRQRAPQWRVYIHIGSHEFSWGIDRAPDVLYEGDDHGAAWEVFEVHVRMLTFDL